MNINIRSINAFKNISQTHLNLIKDEAKYIKYDIGRPICNAEIIPNTIQIIINGEARIIQNTKFGLKTISLVSSGTFIGLSSLLRAEGCETVNASSEVIVMALTDKLIIDLYNEDSSFKDWCNKTIFLPELYQLIEILTASIPKDNLDSKKIVDLLTNNLKLNIAENKSSLKLNSDLINIVGSANMVSKEIGQIVQEEVLVETRGIFPVRIFTIPKIIYNEISGNQAINNSTKKKVETFDVSKLNLESENQLARTSEEEKIGRYQPQTKSKLIKATGIVRESLACLKMLANELELPFRSDAIEKILKDTIRRGKRPTLQNLGGITSVMGLHTSMASIDPAKANRLPSPSLIAWHESFAIVLKSNSDVLEIFSPSEGLIRLKSKDFSKSFEKGSIEILLVEKHDQTPNSKFGLQWLLPAINKYKGVLLQVLLASFVVQLFGLANPLMIQVIIDKVISQRSLDTLEVLGIALVVVTILGGVISSLRTFLFQETTNRIDTRLGAEVIDHLLRLPLKYFDQKPVGELGSRIAELEKIRNFLTGQALTTILDAAFSMIYIIIMVIYSWLLTIIALGVVPIQILLTIIGTPLIRKQIREVATENAKTQSHLVEVLTGIQTVKAQNVENVSRWKWQDLYSKYISKTFQKTITGTALSQTSQVLQQLSQLLVLWIGASLVLKGQLTLGQLIAFRIISGYVTQPLLRLSTIWQNVQELRVSFERLADIIDTPEETSITEKEKIPLPSIEGKVEFENVYFTFDKQLPNVLKKINLTIESGQFVGIVGQSGSGKSTLMKLLPRLYKPNLGRIKIDGYDVDKVELYSLRRQIGIVPQEPLLFAGTINDNIALTDPDSASNEIVKASKIANAHDFIMELQDGYSTRIGERGAGLSGGQKQRIAIARTLLSNPRLLIMDEATSALDYETERKVCSGLKSSSKESTVFFITHRLSTVKNADIIVMMHQGSIAEVGTHDELMNLKGRYFALYRQQESA